MRFLLLFAHGFFEPGQVSFSGRAVIRPCTALWKNESHVTPHLKMGFYLWSKHQKSNPLCGVKQINPIEGFSNLLINLLLGPHKQICAQNWQKIYENMLDFALTNQFSDLGIQGFELDRIVASIPQFPNFHLVE